MPHGADLDGHRADLIMAAPGGRGGTRRYGEIVNIPVDWSSMFPQLTTHSVGLAELGSGSAIRDMEFQLAAA